MSNINYEFKNVFLKKPKPVWATAQNKGQSIILAAIAEGELLNFNTILGNVINNKDNDLLKNKKDVEHYINDCIQAGFLVEIHGEQLWRMFRDKIK